MPSLFFHVTVVPTATVIVTGEKANPAICTVLAEAGAGAGAGTEFVGFEESFIQLTLITLRARQRTNPAAMRPVFMTYLH
jgi:hypothetical protein